jgi:hypothetical protein
MGWAAQRGLMCAYLIIARDDSMRDAVLVLHAHAAQNDGGGPLSNSGSLAKHMLSIRQQTGAPFLFVRSFAIEGDALFPF